MENGDRDAWPLECPECHVKLNIELGHRIRPCAFGRFLQKIGWYSFLVMACLQILIICASGFLHGFWTGWSLFGAMAGPPLFFYSISLFLPRRRTFTCWNCGWMKDYPANIRMSPGKYG